VFVGLPVLSVAMFGGLMSPDWFTLRGRLRLVACFGGVSVRQVSCAGNVARLFEVCG